MIMSDGPRYDDDFYAWTRHQAMVLRTMAAADNRFDRENVAEEIEDLGRSERDAVRSQIRRIIEHLLKLAYSPAQQPRFDWMASIAEARATLGDGVDAPRRHLCAKVTVSNRHQRRRPWSRLPRSFWAWRSTCFRCMERMPPGMCCFASASLARSFSISSQRKPRAWSRWKLVLGRTAGRVKSVS